MNMNAAGFQSPFVVAEAPPFMLPPWLHKDPPTKQDMHSYQHASLPAAPHTKSAAASTFIPPLPATAPNVELTDLGSGTSISSDADVDMEGGGLGGLPSMGMHLSASSDGVASDSDVDYQPFNGMDEDGKSADGNHGDYHMMQQLLFEDYAYLDSDSDSDDSVMYEKLAEEHAAQVSEIPHSTLVYAPLSSHRSSDCIPTTCLHFQTADSIAMRYSPPVLLESMSSLTATFSYSSFGSCSEGAALCSTFSADSQASCSSMYSLGSRSSISNSSSGRLEVLVSCSSQDQDEHLSGPSLAMYDLPDQPTEADNTPTFKGMFPTPLSGLNSLAISSDGSVVAACGDDGMLVVMHLQPPTFLDQSSYTVSQSWVLLLGCPEESEQPEMLNSVKFGNVGGQELIIVGSQDGYVYFFNLPYASPFASAPGPTPYNPFNTHLRTPAHSSWLTCSSLPTHPDSIPTTAPPTLSHSSGVMPEFDPDSFKDSVGPDFSYVPSDGALATKYCLRTVIGASSSDGPPPSQSSEFFHHTMQLWAHNARARETSTLALGPFNSAVNFTVASPDGKWLGITVDQPYVVLMPSCDPHAPPCKLHFPVKACPPYHLRSPACQNTSFNASSTLLAATCDFSLSVFCWSVGSRQLILHLSDHMRPCIAISFLPAPEHAGATAHDTLLAYSQDAGRVHVVDVAHPSSLQMLPVAGPTSDKPLERINGVAISPTGTLLAAGWHALHQWQMLLEWNTERHYLFPPAFKAVVRTMLTAAHLNPTTREPCHPNGLSRGLYDLPVEALQRIFQLAAFPIGAWAAVGVEAEVGQKGAPTVEPLLPVPEALSIY